MQYKTKRVWNPFQYQTKVYREDNFVSIGCPQRKEDENHICDPDICKYGGKFKFINLEDLYNFVLYNNLNPATPYGASAKKFCLCELNLIILLEFSINTNYIFYLLLNY